LNGRSEAYSPSPDKISVRPLTGENSCVDTVDDVVDNIDNVDSLESVFGDWG